MNLIFVKNQDALRLRYPQWADKVLAWAAQDSGPLPVLAGAIQLPESQKPDRPKLNLLFGLGSGETLKAIQQADPEGRVMLLEADPQLFCRTLHHVDLSKIIANPAVHFLVGRPAEHLKMGFVEILRLGDMSNYLPTVTIKAESGFTPEQADYYQKAAAAFNAAVTHFWDLNVGNSVDDLALGLENFLSNLAKLDRCVSVVPYLNAFSDKVGVVVSSGPSLNLSLEALKLLGDRAVIICADSALKTLLKNGIKPFGVATMERDAEIPKLFTGFEIPDDVVYFTTPYIQQDLFESYPGPLAPFFPRLKQFEWLPKLLPTVNTGACCAHLAFQVLGLLGCREVALVGQDFAFDPQTGESYFSGARQENADIEKTHKRYQVPGNNGGTLETHYWWILYRDIFEAMIRERPLPVTNVIPKTHGAKIQGARQEEPAVFFARMAAEPIQALPRDMLEGRGWLSERLAAFQNELTKARADLCLEISRFQKGLMGLQTVDQAATYFACVTSLRQGLSPQAVLLIDEYWSPQAKRFDAAAQSVWLPQEFKAAFPRYLQDWMAALSKLTAVLTEEKLSEAQVGL